MIVISFFLRIIGYSVKRKTVASCIPLAKKSSLRENDSQSNTLQGAACYYTRSSRQNETESSPQSETRNQKTQQSRNKAKQPQQETKHQEPAINNLANNSTALAPCKKSLECLCIQAKRGENCSSSEWSSDSVSSSEENKPAPDGSKTFTLMEKESTHAHPDDKNQLKYQLTAQSSPSSLSAAKSSCNEPKSNLEDTKSKNEPQKKKSPADSCETKNDHLATKVSGSNEKGTPAPAILSALPTSDVRNNSVKKAVMDSEEKQPSGLKESESLVPLQDPVKEKYQRKLPVSNSCSTPPHSQKCTLSKPAVFDCISKEYYVTVSFAHMSKLRPNLFPGGCGKTAEWSKASKENCKELKSNLVDMEPKNEPQKKKSLVDSCETKKDYSATKVSSTYRQKIPVSAILGAFLKAQRDACNDSVKKGVKKNDEKQLTSTNEKETPVPAIRSAPPTSDARNDSLKQGVMDSDEKKSTDLKESDSLAVAQDPVKMECQRKLFASRSLPDPKKCTPSKKAASNCILKEYNGTMSFTTISNRQNLFPSGRGNTAELSKASEESCKDLKSNLEDIKPKNEPKKKKSTGESCETKNDHLATKVLCSNEKETPASAILSALPTSDVRNDSVNSAEWFKASKESFLLSESKEGNVLEISACCPRAKLRPNQACTREDCQHLHVCRDNTAGFCRFGDRCQGHHSFHYDEDRKFLYKLSMLNGPPEENLRKVIQLSLPQVCLDYNKGSCTRGQSCAKIHICKDIIRKKCKNKRDCDLDHESAMTTDHTRTVLERYNMEHWNLDVVTRMVLAYNDLKKGKKFDV